MKTKSKNTWLPYLIWVVVILLITILLYQLFKTDSLKQHKTDLEDELNQLKQQMREKERNVTFLTDEINRLKLLKNSIVDYGLRLYKTIKFILLTILAAACIIGYSLYNFDIIGSASIIVPVITIGYYAIAITIKNKIGDLNRTLQLVQEYFVDFVFKLKGFDVNLIVIIEAKLQSELAELQELRTKCAIYELNTSRLSSK